MRKLGFVVFLMLLAMCGITGSAWGQSLAGDWVGQMGTGFKVRLHFETSGSGFSGKLINPSGNETVLDQVTSDGKHLHFAVDKLALSYDGVWNDHDQVWNGNLTFQQVYPLTLKRATAADMAPAVRKRPQEDAIQAGPAPYVLRDVIFKNVAGHNQLAGTLSVPNGVGPFPAIVLISGTGHNTSDENVLGHKVFLVLADALNRKGIAVLRYDKRGVGGSSGDYDSATTADFTSDARAAVDWLETQPNIDASRVGVLGHSEGGIIAPAVAAEDKSVAFVVMIAGPCIRGDKLFVLQSAATAKAYGAPADYIAKRRIFDQELYTAIISAPSESAALERAKAKIAQGVADKLVDANEAETLAADDTSSWERYFIAYDPAPTLARLTVPILVLNGSLDVQVPAKENLAAAREALKNNSNATIQELPGMNHLLQNATTGAPNEYDGIEETMSPAALGIISDWVSRHTMPDGSASKAKQMSGSEDKMAKASLIFTFYIAAPIEKVWDGFVSKEANRAIFMGADFEVDLKPGGAMTWSGPGKDGKPMRYVTGEVIRAEAPKLLEYKFGPGDGAVKSRVKVELTQESEAVKVVVTNDEWPENGPSYAQNADGWPRILSRLKTLLETGKTFRPH